MHNSRCTIAHQLIAFLIKALGPSLWNKRHGINNKKSTIITQDRITRHIIFIMPEMPEDYVHRIGRTGRAMRAGVAISMCAPYELESLEQIETLLGERIPRSTWPSTVALSDEILPEELDRGPSPIKVKAPKLEGGGAFHEKLDKNKKVPIKVTRADKMKAKYGKRYQGGHSNSTR